MKLLILVLLVVIYVNKSCSDGNDVEYPLLLLDDIDYTYIAYPNKTTWDAAEAYCERKNGTLAVLNIKHLLDSVKNKLTQTNLKPKEFWIGLRCRYHWANGEILNQGSLNVDDKGDKRCYTIENGGGKHFKKEKCNDTKKFICGIPKPNPAVDFRPSPKPPPNDASYTYFNYSSKTTWDAAEAYCESENGTLAVLNTKDLFDSVKNNLKQPGLNPHDFWVGLRCRYYWANGEILNQNSLNVDNKGDKRCYTIENGGGKHFKKEKCNDTKKFICGIPKPNPGISSTRSSSSSSSYTGTSSDLNATQTSTVQPSTTAILSTTAMHATTARPSTFANSKSGINPTPSVTTTNPTSAIYQAAMTTSAVSSIIQTAPTISSSSPMNKEETSSMQASQPSSSSSFYTGTTSDINPTQTSSVQPSTTARPSTFANSSSDSTSTIHGSTYVGTSSDIYPTQTSSAQPSTTAKFSTTAIPSTTARPTTTAGHDNRIKRFHHMMEKLNYSHFDSMSELLTEYDGLIEWIDTKKDIEYNPLTDAREIENIALKFTKQHISKDRKNLSIPKKEIAFHAILVDSDSDSDVTFPEAGEDPDVNTISLPKSLFKGQETYIVNVVYKNNISRLTPTVMEGQDNKTNWSVNTGIFSTTISPKRKEPFEYVNITLHHIQEMEAKPHCSFWNFSIPSSFNGRWSQQGCHVVSSKKNLTVCACNHLTNFAVLMNLNSNKVPSIHKDALLFITYVGLALSLLGEAITVLLYCLFLNLRHEKIQIRVNLLCALAAAQIVFLAGIDKIEDKGMCTFIAALIHLLYLVCFCWMLMEGVYLYRMVVKVFDTHVTMRYSYIFAIGFPLCIVAITLIAASAQSEGIYSYISSEFCWIRWDNGFIWSFIAPVLMLIAINTFFLFSVLKEMALMKSVKSIHSLELSSIRASARACVIILPLLGITWLFGLLSIFSSGVWWQYIFTILNSMQGFMIFVFHCLRNTELRAAIKLRYFQWESTHSSHHNHSRNSTPSKFLTFDDSEKSRSNSLPMTTKINQVTPTD